MMRKTIILVLVCLLLHPDGKTQFDTAYTKNRIRICADSFAMGYLTKNWPLYTRFSYPPLVAKMGGAAEFQSIIRDARTQIPDSCWKKYEPGAVLQVLKTEGDMQAIIELNSILEYNDVRITATSHLVAESWDAGYFWTFFDPLNDSTLARFIKPDLSPSLHIPERKEKMEPLKPSKSVQRPEPAALPASPNKFHYSGQACSLLPATCPCSPNKFHYSGQACSLPPPAPCSLLPAPCFL
ncbi:MAG: hypothetical protein IPP93_09705 [Chitinophagaceae bacterium]|nr:hypothetical protein [Chitinophagaceae bacterium]